MADASGADGWHADALMNDAGDEIDGA